MINEYNEFDENLESIHYYINVTNYNNNNIIIIIIIIIIIYNICIAPYNTIL